MANKNMNTYIYLHACVNAIIDTHKHKGTCHDHLSASHVFLTYFIKVSKGRLTLSMKTSAPKETMYLKKIKHETEQMMNQTESEN